MDTGATNLVNVSEWTNQSALNNYVSIYRPTGLPTIVAVNQDGQTRTIAGWSRGMTEDNIAWLNAN